MNRQTAFQGMVFAVCIFLVMVIGLCSTGCVTQRGAKEMRVIIPAIFEWRVEYHKDDGSEITIGSVRSQEEPEEPEGSDELKLPNFLED